MEAALRRPTPALFAFFLGLGTVEGLATAVGAPFDSSPPALAQGGQDDPDKVHVRIARKVAAATVYVEGGTGSDRQRGSGVIIDRNGIILTSPTACGASSTTVTVYVKGARMFTGKVMGRVNDKEVVLVKVDAKDLPSVELSDSDGARVGQVAYVFGDSFDSIKNDDQPAMSMGVISGIYDVNKKHGKTYYTGKVLETSAAVNPNQDGGPLVDRDGRLLGIVTLNYDESKFTGIAVPVNVIKPVIEKIRKEYEAGGAPVVETAPAPARTGAPWFGVDVKAVDGGLEVTRVGKNSPAEKAGLQRGDILTAADAVQTITEAALKKAIDRKSPGETVKVTLLREGASKELTVRLAKKPIY